MIVGFTFALWAIYLLSYVLLLFLRMLLAKCTCPIVCMNCSIMCLCGYRKGNVSALSLRGSLVIV